MLEYKKVFFCEVTVVSDNKIQNAKDKKRLSADKIKLIIIFSFVAVALIVAMIPIIIMINSEPGGRNNEHDVPSDFLSGTFAKNLMPSSASYTFKEGNKLICVTSGPDNNDFVGGEDSLPGSVVTVTTEYTYRVFKDGQYSNGEDRYIIELTDNNGNVDEYDFIFGTDRSVYYRCEKDNCSVNDESNGLGRPISSDDDPREEGTEYCSSHSDSKIYTEEVVSKFISFGDNEVLDTYYKVEN